MKVFGILKKIAQILGVFPFEQRNIFYISKLYLIVNIFVGFCLVLSASLIVKVILQEKSDSEKLMQTQGYPLYLTVHRLTEVIIIGRLTASLTTVATKFMWRKEHVENLNATFEFSRKHRLNSILDTTSMSDYSFILIFYVLLLTEISSPLIEAISGNDKIYLTYYNFGVGFQIIFDEIMFCVVCSALSKYQRAIKEMISIHETNGKTEGITRNDISIVEIMRGDVFRSQLHQERSIERSYGRNVSVKARKLESFRRMNLKIFDIYSNYSALHQYQLFLSTAVSTMEITSIIFGYIAFLTQDMQIHSNQVLWQAIKLLARLVSNLIRIFMVCYYNDKAFNEGVTIKYIIQEIRQRSNEKDIIKVLKIFMEQLHMRKQFQICGVFAFNMTLPVTFIEYAMNYVVVLVQCLGLKV